MQRVVNFGSVLQAYSLREILREVTGETPVFLDIENEPSVPSNATIKKSVDYTSAADYPPGLLQKGKRWVIARLSRKNKALIRRFMEQELKLSSSANNGHYDCVVVGSDEVFNHNNGIIRLQLHGRIPQATKVISYAASCGSALPEDVPREQLPRIQAALRNYSAFSLRDSATQDYITSIIDTCPQRHLDPVLVGNLDQRPHKAVPISKYLLVYAYGQRIRTREEISAIRSFAKARGLKTVAMGGSQFWCDLYLPASPFRLLDYFFHADYVVTDTFHGTIFSVIHQKKFVVIPRATNRNKLSSLLQDLGLENRMADDIHQLPEILTADIDYREVQTILDREKQRTRMYLKSQLEEVQ